MTRADNVAKMRAYLHEVGEASRMVAVVMKRNKVATVDELSEKHPKQFNSLLVAIEVMEEEMPEPDFPWPKA